MGSTESNTLQEQLFHKVRQRISNHLKLADEIADLLNVSVDSAYRRLRGETQLTIDEVSAICRQYGISFDSVSKAAENVVAFNYNPLFKSEANFEYYLSFILQMLEKVKSVNGEIIYAAEDVPVLRSLAHPSLAQFKIFYWLKSVLNDTTLPYDQFEHGILPEKYGIISEKIRNAYNEVKSIEIWTEETLYSTLKQIEFFWQSGRFKTRDDALKVWEDMRNVMLELKDAAEKESKQPLGESNSSFVLYDCEVLIGNNCIILKADDWCRTFISYNSMNSLSTEDENFNQEAIQWVHNLMKKSSMLSGIAEKQRFRFFRKMEEKIQHTLKVIQTDLF